MIKEDLKKAIHKSIDGVLSIDKINVEYPADISHGDFSTNIALALAKKEGVNPHDLAGRIADDLNKQNIEFVDSVEVAGPGFINFRLTEEYFHKAVESAMSNDEYGKGDLYKHRKMIVEFTDPNPFKVFHIGHLMSNVIGESLSRLFEYAGAEVKRATYQGDVGMHIAKAIWGISKMEKREDNPDFLGKAYVYGAKAYEEDDGAKAEIEEINRKIYDRSDKEINEIYDWGRKISLEAFEVIYKRLGSEFDYNFFESEAAPLGKELVLEWVKSGLFQESEGAFVFKGEEHGLHTRVFINSKGLPTYEGKELALPSMKYEKFKYTDSFIVTGNEVNDYFKVLLAVLEKISPELAKNTTHIGHGMLRMPEGKMSSRSGNVITGESLLDDTKERVLEKMVQLESTDPQANPDSNGIIADKIAVGAIKYSILKQGIGKNIIFDTDTALSFEGDSGPYVQYSAVRAQSILTKSTIKPSLDSPEDVGVLERYISRFPDIVEHAVEERAPQVITNFVTLIASEFSSYYAQNPISENPYRLSLTRATLRTLKNGLHLMGIETPEKM